jgi:hypothetical protein
MALLTVLASLYAVLSLGRRAPGLPDPHDDVPVVETAKSLSETLPPGAAERNT